jgi:hypothetical protein
VKTQIWCAAVSTYVLVAIIEKELKLEASLYNMLQILSISVFEKSLMTQAFQPELEDEELHGERKQLILFDF